MSFGNRMRRARAGSAGLLIASLVGTLGMANTMAPPPAANVVSSGVSQTPREFVAEAPAKKRAKPTITNRLRKGGGSDSRHARRRVLMAMAGLNNTGRQWIRVRRSVRAGSYAWLLNTPAGELATIAETNTLILAPR